MSRKRGPSQGGEDGSQAGQDDLQTESSPSAKRAKRNDSADSGFFSQTPPKAAASQRSRIHISPEDDDLPDDSSQPNGHTIGGQKVKLQANGADGGEVEDELPEHEEDQEGDEGEDEVYEEPDELGLDGENEEQVEEVAAEISRSREVSGNVAEMGVIERIELVNFMCHKLLTVSFGPQINFVIGHNGSGKSAILTGITVALGGKASSTSRGSSIKSFVREGSSAAQVTLQLKNQGNEAFKPEVYGQSIIVERRINADGGGHWKIKSAQGKTVSTKREELNAICDHANIQVDNPMNVLSQDAARQFLSSSHADEKYSFFLRGTQLTQLATEYEVVQTNIKKIKVIIAKKEETLPELEQQAREATARWQLVDRTRRQRDKVDQFKNEMVWSQVIAKEKELAESVQATENASLKLAKIEEHIERAQGTLSGLEERITELEERASEGRDREEPLRQKRAELNQKIRENRDKLHMLLDEEKGINSTYARLREQEKSLEARIADETRKLNEDNRERREALDNTRRKLEDERQTLEAQKADKNNEYRTAEQELRTLNQGLSAAVDEQKRQRNKVAELDTLIARLNSTRSNRIMAFGQSIPQLLQAINNETRWKKKPVGPLGLHLELKDQKWAPVLESVIGTTLDAFSVTNHDDRRLLTELMRRTRCASPILTGSDEPFDFSAGEPDPQFLTILRVLNIDDDFVTRQLVNSVHIERAVLVERRADGDQLMRTKPANVMACFTIDLFRVGGVAGGSSTQALTASKGVPRFQTNIEEQIREAQAAYAQAEQVLQSANAKVNQLQSQHRQLENGMKSAQASLPGINRAIRSKADEIARLEEEMREDEPANIGALEQARKETEQEREEAKRNFEDVQKRKEDIEAANRPLVEESEQLKRQIDTFNDTRSSLQADLEAAVTERLQAQSAVKHRKEQVEQQTRKIRDAETAQQELEEEVAQWTEQATEYCPRVETRRSAEWLEQQINAIELQLKEASRRSGESVEAVMMDVRARTKAYEDAKKELDSMRQCIVAMDEAIKIRLEKWHYFRRLIALRAKGQFTYHLQNRGYTGSLDFNHDTQKLKLRVQTEDSANSQRDKDPKSLSGGEKSFSTICLLLSLWEAIGCPIRCLDEFDVFMDAVNRKISMKMMIDTAKTSQGVQYILITPQNMANVSMGPEVRVHRMLDPERGQAVLEMAS